MEEGDDGWGTTGELAVVPHEFYFTQQIICLTDILYLVLHILISAVAYCCSSNRGGFSTRRLCDQCYLTTAPDRTTALAQPYLQPRCRSVVKGSKLSCINVKLVSFLSWFHKVSYTYMHTQEPAPTCRQIHKWQLFFFALRFAP